MSNDPVESDLPLKVPCSAEHGPRLANREPHYLSVVQGHRLLVYEAKVNVQGGGVGRRGSSPVRRKRQRVLAPSWVRPSRKEVHDRSAYRDTISAQI